MENTSRRAQPGASTGDNNELVPATAQDVEDALEDVRAQQDRHKSAGDVLGMSSAPAKPDDGTDG